MENKMAIIGATGNLGKPVVRQLVAARFDVTVVARNTEKAANLFPGVKLAEADIRSKDALVAALTGQHFLYLNLNLDPTVAPTAWQAEREGLTNILDAAKTAGIQKIGFISSLVMNYQGLNGFNWWVFDLKKQAVEMIRKSSIPSIVFYPSTFMESFPYIYRQGKRLMLAGKSMCPMWYIAGDDYGRQVANAFQLVKPGDSAEFVVQGPEPFTADEAARVFLENYPKEKLSVMKAPLGLLKLIGKLNQKVNYGANIIEALNNYPEKFEAQPTWDVLGRPTTTLKEFAAACE